MVHLHTFKLVFTGDYTHHHVLARNLDINCTVTDMK